MTPYFEDEWTTLYLGDARELDAWRAADAIVTDPPYGYGYHTGQRRLPGNARSIANDLDTTARDEVLAQWGEDGPALVFGSRKRPAPAGTRMVLIWDNKGALGMGDLSLPWRPSWQEIYVIGKGFTGARTSGVLAFPPVQAMGRFHPNEKPVDLLAELVSKCPPGVIGDPFAGSGSTLLAARREGRKAVGCEVDERYCEVIASRFSQAVLL